ncbi:MAG: T9SS type A sorting domain-containing protein [Prevotella sp.]|nr:T9SS type A sorting domain-containing protein [Prevotella sp.]
MIKKKLFILAGIALLSFTTPALAANMVMEMGVAEQVDEQAPTISVEGNTVSVQNASGMNLEVVSLTGRAVASYKIEGPAQRIELNLPKGCYILKVGKVVRKVTVR